MPDVSTFRRAENQLLGYHLTTDPDSPDWIKVGKYHVRYFLNEQKKAIPVSIDLAGNTMAIWGLDSFKVIKKGD